MLAFRPPPATPPRRHRFAAFALVAGLVLIVPGAAGALNVPQQLTPADGAALPSVNITFTWGSVAAPGGAKYGIQIQYLNTNNNWKAYKTVDNITWYGGGYTFANFTNSDHGRWRVRAMTATGNSAYSGWRVFSLVGAGGEVPSPTVNEYQQTIGVAAHDSTTFTVGCPSGTIVIGGGWRSGRPYHVRATLSVQSNNGWMVGFENLTASAKTVDVFAQCLRGASGYSFSVPTLSNVLPGHLGAPIATCTKGVRTGGGFRAPNLRVFAAEPISAPDPHSWLVFSYNQGAATEPLYAEAVCLAGTGLTTSLKTSSAQSASAGGTVTASVSCPANRVALAGGFGGQEHSLEPMSSRRSGNGWKASGYNGGTQSWTLLAYAVCAKVN